MADRGTYRWHLNRSAEQVGSAVTDLMRAASGRSVFLDHPLQRRFQDIQAGLGHAFLHPDAVAKAAGGTLLGTTTPELVL
jgi:3-hydroxy-9,10-secoandrosta-1,3,5(10)-triene-9,17-dione monooxygenase